MKLKPKTFVKKHRVLLVIVATLALLVLLFFGFRLYQRHHTKPAEPLLTAHFGGNEEGMSETVLYHGSSAYKAFFPAYASLDAVTFSGDTVTGAVLIGGKEVSFGEPVDLTTTAEAALLLKTADGEEEFPLLIYQSENLATLSVRTKSGSTDWIHASKENQEDASAVCILADGTVDVSGEGTLKCHGNSTFAPEKKSYRLKFEKRTGLLGMDPAKKWILTSNVYDASKLRNRLNYFLAERLGLPFAVGTEFVDLYINGEYRGNYLICDSMNVAKNRIDIEKSGSFLIVADWREEKIDFVDDHGQPFNVDYPEEADEAVIEAIRAYLNEIEQEIVDLDEEDSLDALATKIDLDTFVTMYLVDALSNEVDTNVVSTYYYYNSADGLLHAGPAWDFDRSLGNQRNMDRDVRINDFFSGFPEQLWKNREFRELVKKKLLQNEGLYEEALTFFEEEKERIRASAELDDIRWGSEWELLLDFSDFDTNTDYVRWYFEKRYALIEDTILHPDDYCRVMIGSMRSGRILWMKRGETLTETLLSDLALLYECDGFTLENGMEVFDGLAVVGDLLLFPQKAVPVEETEKGDTSMKLLIFIILFMPGLLALYLSGNYVPRRRRDLVTIAVRYGCYSFLSLLFTYLVIFLIKGNVTIAWSTGLDGYDYPLSHTNVLVEIMILQLLGSALIGILARLKFLLFKRGDSVL